MEEVFKMWSKTWIVVLGTDDDCPVEQVHRIMAPRKIGLCRLIVSAEIGGEVKRRQTKQARLPGER